MEQPQFSAVQMDEVKEYDAEIRKIDLNHEDTNKSFVIQVTDKELLAKLQEGLYRGSVAARLSRMEKSLVR